MEEIYLSIIILIYLKIILQLWFLYYYYIGIFENLTPLTVTTTGLVHHCSQYGVTLIIPEGAIEHTATVWFGVCLFSDKFKFEDDYIPVSPIVWIYINCQLIKPAEIYLPHHINETVSNRSFQ